MLEPLSDRALAKMEPLAGARALDVACGAGGLLRAISKRVGDRGEVIGSDLNETMIAEARAIAAEEGLGNVRVVKDDLFASELAPASFDLVHARFVRAPLGRDDAVMDALLRLAKPGGRLLLEEPIGASWCVVPDDGAHAALVALVARAYDRHLGGFDAGKRLFALAQQRGLRDVVLDAQTLALPPGHPYLECAVMMATALRAVLLRDTSAEELDAAIAAARALYARPETHGFTFTLVQLAARAP